VPSDPEAKPVDPADSSADRLAREYRKAIFSAGKEIVVPKLRRSSNGKQLVDVSQRPGIDGSVTVKSKSIFNGCFR
jgi:hypothetical protein